MRMLYIAKRRLLLLLLPIMAVISTLYAYEPVHSLTGKVIVVDAGHGGIDTGANRPGIQEKDINLAVALALKDELNQLGAKVILSRESDIELSPECDNEKVKGRYHRDLAARVEMVQESDADIFISIHANAVSKSQRHGAEVFFSAKSESSKALATSIQNELCKITQVNYNAQAANYFVLRRNKVPAVLVEVGYITNIEERRLLQKTDYQKQLAQAIAKGVYLYH